MCESCVILARELSAKIARLYTKSEADFIDMSESVCQSMLQFKVHKELSGVNRFQKDESQTMKTLKQLKDKGVEVKLDIPFEMWDQPAAEVSILRQNCDMMLAEYEDELSEWFVEGAQQPLQDFLCRSRVLRGKDTSCISSKDDGKVEL